MHSKDKTQLVKDLNKIVQENLKYIQSEPPPPGNSIKKAVQDICQKLESALNAVCDDIIREYHSVENSTGVDVIHYTSIGTVISMLEDVIRKKEKLISTKERENVQNTAKDNEVQVFLRMYDSIHFNDPDEGKFIIRYLPEKYNWLVKEYERIEKKDWPCAYIASFVSSDQASGKDMSDNLVFWRGYGGEGEGCSLSLPKLKPKLQKVIYGGDRIKSTLKELYATLDILDPLLELRDDSEINITERLSKTVIQGLEKIRYLYKSEAYDYEKECRLVLTEPDINQDKIRYEYQQQNNFSGRMRHYYEHKDLDITKLLVSGSDSLITLGPCVQYQENIRDCIEKLTTRASLVVAIRDSGINYQIS